MFAANLPISGDGNFGRRLASPWPD